MPTLLWLRTCEELQQVAFTCARVARIGDLPQLAPVAVALGYSPQGGALSLANYSGPPEEQVNRAPFHVFFQSEEGAEAALNLIADRAMAPQPGLIGLVSVGPSGSSPLDLRPLQLHTTPQAEDRGLVDGRPRRVINLDPPRPRPTTPGLDAVGHDYQDEMRRFIQEEEQQHMTDAAATARARADALGVSGTWSVRGSQERPAGVVADPETSEERAQPARGTVAAYQPSAYSLRGDYPPSLRPGRGIEMREIGGGARGVLEIAISETADRNLTRLADTVARLQEQVLSLQQLREQDAANWRSLDHRVISLAATVRGRSQNNAAPGESAVTSTASSRLQELIRREQSRLLQEVMSRLGGQVSDEQARAIADLYETEREAMHRSTTLRQAQRPSENRTQSEGQNQSENTP